MSDNRPLAEKYMQHICASEFEKAFNLLDENVVYIIIGKTAVSGGIHGRQNVIDTLVGALGAFQQPMVLKFKNLVVEGNCAVGFASGEGVGPTGVPYSQPYYCMEIKFNDYGSIIEVVEYMDTVSVEEALFNKKLIDPTV